MYYPDYYLLPVPILCIISYVLYMKAKFITPFLILFVIGLTIWIWISDKTDDILKILSTIIAIISSGLALNFSLHINTRKQTQEGDNNQQSGDNSKNVKQSEGTIQQAGESNQVDNSMHNNDGVLCSGNGNTVNQYKGGDTTNIEKVIFISKDNPPLPFSEKELIDYINKQTKTENDNEN